MENQVDVNNLFHKTQQPSSSNFQSSSTSAGLLGVLEVKGSVRHNKFPETHPKTMLGCMCSSLIHYYDLFICIWYWK